MADFSIFSFLGLLLALANFYWHDAFAQFRLFSIDKALKRILLEMEKQTPLSDHQNLNLMPIWRDAGLP